MEGSDKLRVFGGGVCGLAVLYYAYQIYYYVSNWYSVTDIKKDTSCTEIYMLEVWLLTQDILWLVSLFLVLVVLLKPEAFKLLLCFMYLMGPVYFSWSAVAVGYYSAFLACCKKSQDQCTTFYPYSHPASFVVLLLVSLIFSALISVYLLALVTSVFWRYVSHRLESYRSLMN